MNRIIKVLLPIGCFIASLINSIWCFSRIMWFRDWTFQLDLFLAFISILNVGFLYLLIRLYLRSKIIPELAVNIIAINELVLFGVQFVWIALSLLWRAINPFMIAPFSENLLPCIPIILVDLVMIVIAIFIKLKVMPQGENCNK